MRTTIAEVLSADNSQGTIKSTTDEELSYAGRKEGIAAYGVGLLTQQAGKTECK